MPTRFTANALAISNASNLSRVGLYHSSAWYQMQKIALQENAEASHETLRSEQDLARLLEAPVTVTTLDHLCISLTGTREDHHVIFFNLAHSCVVIDEADFYDTFTQANMLILLQALSLLKVPVLLMSATLPESSKQFYLAPKIHEDTSNNTRIRCHITPYPHPVVKPSDIQELLEPAINGTPTILYANTVQRAQRYYQWLKRHGVEKEDIVLYHSRFREPHKLAIEKQLTSMLGREAWESNKQHGIAILTQIGELSVNISADYMLSELCPLDRLVQRVGRLSRFSDTRGELHILSPHKRDDGNNVTPYPAPYGTYQLGAGWQPSPALKESASMLQEGDYSAQRFVDLINTLYAKLPEMDSKSRGNKDRLIGLIVNNWLMNREEEVEEEADGTQDWKCRDIDPQVVVIADFVHDQFAEGGQWMRSWEAWRGFLLEHGITCQTYEFQRAVRNGCLTEASFIIGSDGREIQKKWLVKSSHYDLDLGLCFDDIDDDD